MQTKHILHCPLSGSDPTYISPLNIFCIIEYVMNKKTLEPFYPLLPTSIMCLQYIPVVSQQRSYIKRRWQRNLAHLQPICTSPSLPLSFSMGLWNGQSAVNKADLIPAIAFQTALIILGLTETWIRPEDSATPAALSNNFSFSHTPVRLGRVEVLVLSFLTIGNTQLILP